MRPSLDSLKVLEICVASGSFARAAERLFLTPTAVSLRIRILEEALGEPLFIRRGPRVAPTPKAMLLAKGVRRGLDEIAAALTAFGAASPPLRITAPPTLASRWLAPRLSSYQRCEIELDVSTEIRDPSDFDVAIRTGAGDWPGLRGFRLFPVQLAPLLAPSLAAMLEPLTPETLATLPLLPHPDWERWFVSAIGHVPPGLNFTRVEYPNHELNVNAACAGEGVALVPPGFFEPIVKSGALMAPFDKVLEGPDWHFALIRNDDGRPGPKEFCDWLYEHSRRMSAALEIHGAGVKA
ncbi:LysR substrate-binding domain-containing protein [Rhizobium sp. No.120]